MEIVAFQAFIFISIAVARLFAKDKLLGVCLVWTAFTLLLVFASPLILLQLCTIWGSYNLLAPKRVEETVANTPELATVETADQAENANSEVNAVNPLGSLATGLTSAGQGIARAIDDLDQIVRTEQATQKATSEIASAISSERILLEQVLKTVESDIRFKEEYESKDAEYRRLFDEAYKRVSRSLEKSLAEDKQKPLSWPTQPNFKSVATHPDPRIAEAIARKLEKIRTERQAFLSSIAQRLSKDSKLEQEFRKKVLELGGAECWGILAPMIKPTPSLVTLQPSPFEQLFGVPTEQRAGTDQDIIREKAIARAIPFLVHFTRVENIPSIMARGLCPIAKLKSMGAQFLSNDPLRLDGHPDASSVSIGHPNDRMFYKYRRSLPGSEWVVLMIEPSMLWTAKTAFCRHNAADARISRQPLEKRATPAAFDELFEPDELLPSRESQLLAEYDPTDPQAEILVFDDVPPRFISGAVFSSEEALLKYQPLLKDRQLSVHKEGQGLFGLRSSARPATRRH